VLLLGFVNPSITWQWGQWIGGRDACKIRIGIIEYLFLHTADGGEWVQTTNSSWVQFKRMTPRVVSATTATGTSRPGESGSFLSLITM
jgi:hypothetical protein